MNKLLKWTPIAFSVLLAMQVNANSQVKTHDAITTMEVSESTLILNQLIEHAIKNDLKRSSLIEQSKAILEQGISNATFMDPKLRLGAANVPVDTWTLTDDAMTNLAVGIGQQFPRGNILDLEKQKSQHQSQSSELSAELRSVNVARVVCQMWLKLGYLDYVERNLNQRIELQQQLVQFNQTNYSLGKKSAQEVLNSELAISRLEEKRDANFQLRQQSISQLSEWLGVNWNQSQLATQASNQVSLPKIEPLLSSLTVGDHYPLFRQHPLVEIAEKMIAVKETEVAIKRENFKPQFGVEVSYGYRQANSMNGGEASDVVSAFVTLDLPLFTKNKQDKALSASQLQLGASRFDRDLLLQNINAKVNDIIARYEGLNTRSERYRKELIPQSSSRVNAVQRAYDANTASFSELVATRQDHLALQLEYQNLITERSQAKADLAYWLNGFAFEPSSSQVQF
ncbi:TolC family protein [Vibrio sp.]|nr:TolC family protein [Vibrio sp.]